MYHEAIYENVPTSKKSRQRFEWVAKMCLITQITLDLNYDNCNN